MRSRIAATAGMVMITGALGALLSGTLSWGQTSEPFRPKPPGQTADDKDPPVERYGVSADTPVKVPYVTHGGEMALRISTVGEVQNLRPANRFGSQLSSLKRKLKQADTDDKRKATEEEIRTLLESYFEADLGDREERVEDLKERFAELERQIQKRKDAKSKIIDLQLEVIRNEAAGLGFYSTTNNRSGIFDAPPAAASGYPTPPAGFGSSRSVDSQLPSGDR